MTDQTEMRRVALHLTDELRQDRDPKTRVLAARALKHEIVREVRLIEEQAAYEMRRAGVRSEDIGTLLGVHPVTVVVWASAHADRNGLPDPIRRRTNLEGAVRIPPSVRGHRGGMRGVAP